MGWTTYTEFASPLHDRENFVLSTHPDATRGGFRAVESVDQLIAEHTGQDVWIIGGGAVYTRTIASADELLLTQVNGDFKCTKFFPPYESDFRLTTKSDDHVDGGVRYRFETWQRIRQS